MLLPTGLSLEKMDDLFGVTELLQHKQADTEHGPDAGDMDKTTESRIERLPH